jgi:hypothetical protein
MRKTIGAIVVALAVAGVGGAAIAAATDGGHSMFEGGMGGPGGPPRSAPTARHIDAEPASVHGEFVVADGRGGFTTQVSQTGRVTAISATSVTARSDDGFVRTYVIREINGATTPPLSVGDAVDIKATREGETAVIATMRPPLSSNGLPRP